MPMKTILLAVLLLLTSCTSVPAPQQVALFRAAIITTINSFAVAGAIKEAKRQELVLLVNAAGDSMEALLAAFQTVNQAAVPPLPPPPAPVH
jgi:hypothetical protein